MVSSRETARQDVNCKHEFASRIANIGRRLGKDAGHGAGSGHCALGREPGAQSENGATAKSSREIADLGGKIA